MAVATFFGAGLSPRAPGTVGSAASLVLWAPLVLWGAPLLVRVVVVAVVFGLGVVASQRVVALRGEDPQIVVIDEVAGMGVALLFPWASPWYLLVGFVLFRFFDIVKPWPVSWADRRVGGGLGVMLDDMLAGLYALGVFVFAVVVLGHLSPDFSTIHPDLPSVMP